MPTSRSCARYDAARPNSVMNSEACLLFTALTISAIERCMSAPAWNSVASSAPARSFQWPWSPAAFRCVAPTIASAVRTA